MKDSNGNPVDAKFLEIVDAAAKKGTRKGGRMQSPA
jgi:hypothetical protein